MTIATSRASEVGRVQDAETCTVSQHPDVQNERQLQDKGKGSPDKINAMPAATLSVDPFLRLPCVPRSFETRRTQLPGQFIFSTCERYRRPVQLSTTPSSSSSSAAAAPTALVALALALAVHITIGMAGRASSAWPSRASRPPRESHLYRGRRRKGVEEHASRTSGPWDRTLTIAVETSRTSSGSESSQTYKGLKQEVARVKQAKDANAAMVS